MRVSWTKGLEKQAAIDVKQNYKEAVVIRRRLRELLLEKISASHKASFSKEGYESGNWAYLQADARGYERALNDVVSMISEEAVDKPS